MGICSWPLPTNFFFSKKKISISQLEKLTPFIGEYLELSPVILIHQTAVLVFSALCEEPVLMLVQRRQPQVAEVLPKLQNKGLSRRRGRAVSAAHVSFD